MNFDESFGSTSELDFGSNLYCKFWIKKAKNNT